VLTLQDGDPFEHVFKRVRIRLFLPLLRYGFRHATVVQTISNYLATWARALGYVGDIKVIPNGVDAKHFSHYFPPREELRARWHVHMSDVVLASSSRLVHKNALDDVIRALRFLPEHVHFINFGSGPDKEKLEALAQKEGVASRVQLLPHPGLKELPKYLQASDIFVRPSRSEGMGVSFVEAFAAGLPVIATQEGGIADFLFDSQRNPDKPPTGFVVDKDSPKQIALQVEEILSNHDHVKKVVENAKQLAFEKYVWSLITKDMRDRIFARVV